MSSEKPASDAPIIEARGLSKTYRMYRRPQDRLFQSVFRRGNRRFTEVNALNGVDFEVARGETLGIVGRNGCGKTTLLQLVTGILSPTAGEVHVRGKVTGLLELGAGFNPEFTGIENIYLYATLMGLSKKQTDDVLPAILDFADIGDFVFHPVKAYSTGMYMRLAFAAAIHGEPEILVIDEALAVGDEAFQRKCFSRLTEMKRAGTTLLFVSHSAAWIIELCDRALLLDGGERLLCGTPKLVVTRYHRLLYSHPDKLEELREETRALDSPQNREVSEGPVPITQTQEPPTEATVAFDPGLVPKSTVRYPTRGAEIESVRLAGAGGEAVNQLARGGSYEIRLQVRFDEEASHVRFGTTISTPTGVELSGMMSHPPSEDAGTIEAGTRLLVCFRFCNRLLPGLYFVRAGVVATQEGEEVFLHRIIDALMFRVRPEKDLPLIGVVDLSEGASCEIVPEPGNLP